MSRLKLANLLLFQWTGFRLARVLEEDGSENGWAVLGPVLPLTGWWCDYIGWPVARLFFGQR